MSDDQIIAAQSLFNLGKTFSEIAAFLEVPTLAVRAQLDEDYFESCRRSAKRIREEKTRARRDIPDYEFRDVTGILCGDPIFERSALYRKQRGLE